MGNLTEWKLFPGAVVKSLTDKVSVLYVRGRNEPPLYVVPNGMNEPIPASISECTIKDLVKIAEHKRVAERYFKNTGRWLDRPLENGPTNTKITFKDGETMLFDSVSEAENELDNHKPHEVKKVEAVLESDPDVALRSYNIGWDFNGYGQVQLYQGTDYVNDQ